jgi:hypothetical protein
MSSGPDRIPVPSNGKGPHRVDGPPPPADVPPPDESTVVFTPTQLAVGFGILASLIVLVARRLGRRGRSGR